MKLYHNITRFQFRRHYPKGSYSEKKLLWAASLKPGAVISACTGFNVEIATIVPERMRMSAWNGKGGWITRARNGWFITDFDVVDTNGGFHSTNSCCWKPETVEQIEKYWLEPTDEELDQTEKDGWGTRGRTLRDALRSGKKICDERGVCTFKHEKVSIS